MTCSLFGLVPLEWLMEGDQVASRRAFSITKQRNLCLSAAVALLLSCVAAGGAHAAALRFEDYPVASVYTGEARLPDFAGRDRAFRQYRTRIREGMGEGPDFAGEFSLIQIGCGTGCSRAFVASHRSGKVFEFPRGGEENLLMQFSRRLESRLLILQWGSYRDDACVIEYFEWTGGEARPLRRMPVGDAEACARAIDENLAD